MKATMNTLDEAVGVDRVIASRQDAGAIPSRKASTLNITVVYEDPSLQEWARGVCDRVTVLVGPEAVRCIWWNLGDLGEPAVLAGAVSTALRADIIIIAVHAAEGFPLPFYVWVDSWLPHRPQGAGALVGLVAFSECLSPPMDRAREYLQMVAREARIDFVFEERRSEPKTTDEDGSSSFSVTAEGDAVAALPSSHFRCPEFEN